MHELQNNEKLLNLGQNLSIFLSADKGLIQKKMITNPGNLGKFQISIRVYTFVLPTRIPD